MKSNIYDFKHYRDYLNARLAVTGATRGLRSRLAEEMKTAPAFITKVLSGGGDLSPEHIPPTNRLLQHSLEEAHFFTLLVLEARAGSQELEKYYRDQLNELREKRHVLMERIKTSENVSTNDLARYYSQWFYAAIHALVDIPQFQTREEISERLDLPLALVSKTLEELMAMGLVEQKDSKYLMGKKRIHLEKNSPWVSQLHSNFRQRAVHRLAAPEATDFHFSMAMSVSRAFIEKYRKKIIDFIGEQEKEMAEAKEEELFALNIDLFKF